MATAEDLAGLQIESSKRDYILTTLNPALEGLIVQLIAHTPADPVPFMIDYLTKQSGTNAPATGGSSGEVDELKKEVEELKQRLAAMNKKQQAEAVMAARSSVAGAKEEEEDEEEEEEDDDDDVDELPESFRKPEGQFKVMRTSVSAEAYGAWNTKKAFEPPVIAKSGEQETKLRDVLSKSFLFQALEEKEMTIVIKALKEVKVAAKERIIKQGDNGDFMFVIEKGVLDCYLARDGEEKMVKTCEAGDAFGELALLYNCPRAASVEAREDSVCWQLDRETFNHIVKDAAQKKRQRYESFLKGVSLLSNMGNYELSQVADALIVEKFKKDEYIVKQDEPGDKFYLVEEGACIAEKTVDGKATKVMDYSAGEYFGELALLKNAPRAASVKVTSDNATVLALDRRSFKRLLGSLESMLEREMAKYN